jgi:hypothetical protein
MTDPFKRRYQVFVSSTFEDLIDERRHVMQALLESKCIPSGMELFPAASESQWNVIKRVIDDCDYYLVILGGRYGSCGPDGLSFTEMEFDYAVQKEKPVLGFCHANLDSLIGSKLDKRDSDRAKLSAFIAKVESQLCRKWTTAEGLASAVKSAILNAIEFDPKPGWIRAGAVPDPDLVRRLNQRIVELEERISETPAEKFPSGKELLEMPANVTIYESDDPNDRFYWFKKPIEISQVFESTWDEVFMVIAERWNGKKPRLTLKNIFQSWLAIRLEPMAKSMISKHLICVKASVDPGWFERVLQTFVARGLVKRVRQPKHVRLKELYWELTGKGVKKLADLQAYQSQTNANRN